MKLLFACIFFLMGYAGINLNAQVAQSPPMGWNSYDCFGATVTEQEIKDNARIMAAHLKKAGWEYVVVDYCWFYPNVAALNNPPQTDYDFQPRLIMDEYSRLWPDPERFPSSAGDKGFKPLADYVHSLGLKFGIHVMRGIPRQAAFLETGIKGTDVTAADLVNPEDTCTWLDNMYGIDWSKEGGQEYYNSLLDLYTSWGVDYIKVDDILAIGPYHQEDINALRKAIDQYGSEIVLSLSPGQDYFRLNRDNKSSLTQRSYDA